VIEIGMCCESPLSLPQHMPIELKSLFWLGEYFCWRPRTLFVVVNKAKSSQVLRSRVINQREE
jgi:hypothetical protein